MEVKGDYLFDAPVGQVWELLLDADVLARCMPGCEKLVPLEEHGYEATLSVGVGSVYARLREAGASGRAWV